MKNLIIAAALISPSVQAQNSTNTLDYSLKVEFNVPTLSGIPQQGHGTGFIVDKVNRIVMTAAHVVPGVLPGLRQGILTVEGSPATLLCLDGEHDLAVLQVGELPEEKRAPLIDPNYRPKVGDTYQSALQNENGMTFEIQHNSTGVYLQVPMTLTSSGTITSVSNAVRMNVDGTKTPTNTEILITDKPSKPGFSGGPAVDKDGRLVGVQIRVDTSFGVLSSVRNVQNLLSKEVCKK